MEYFILKPDGEQTGAFTIEQIRLMVHTGFIDHDTRFWYEGSTGWQPIGEIEAVEARGHVAASTEPRPSPTITRRPPPYSRLVPHPNTKSLPKIEPSPATAQAAATAVKNHVPTAAKKPAPPLAGKTELPVEAAPKPVVMEAPVVPAEVVVPVEAEVPAQPGSVTLPGFHIGAYILYAVPLLLFILVMVFVRPTVPAAKTADASSREVSLAGDDVYVLLDQAAIKPFEDAMRDSPVLESLTKQLSETTDPMTVQRINIGVEKERVRHQEEVRLEFIQSGKAQLVEAGTYAVLADFDDNGVLTVRHEGAGWVALSYRDTIVFAHSGVEQAAATTPADSGPPPPPASSADSPLPAPPASDVPPPAPAQ